jgi:hypothetical protein
MIKGIRKISRVRLEEISYSSVHVSISLARVNEMQFEVIDFSVDEMFRLMMNVEAISFVDGRYTTFSDVHGGDRERIGQVYVLKIVCELGVFGIWRRVDI